MQTSAPFPFLKNLPIAVCGLTLGLAGLGNMVGEYSVVLRLFYLSIAAVLWFCLLLKVILFQSNVKEEFQNPLTLSLFEAFFMTLLQFIGPACALSPALGKALWLTATAGHLVLVCIFSYRVLRDYRPEKVFTTYILLYGGNMLAAVMSPYLHFESPARLILLAGFVMFLPWYPIAFFRYRNLPVGDAVKPTFCIFAAPFSLALAGYLSCISHPNLYATIILALIAQLMYLYVLLQLPRILKLPFFPSYGALTFPLVIPATAFQKTLGFLSGMGIAYPSVLTILLLAEKIFAVVIVTYVMIRYLHFLAGQFHINKKGD